MLHVYKKKDIFDLAFKQFFLLTWAEGLFGELIG